MGIDKRTGVGFERAFLSLLKIMKVSNHLSRSLALVALIACMAAPVAHAAPDAAVLAEAAKQKAPFLDTLKDLVSI